MTIREFVSKLHSNNNKCTLLGVGPVSKIVIEATFQACKNYQCPPIFIASRNQVDLKELGHGYLMGGMDQKTFAELIEKIRQEVGYDGPVYICRDHGGPWQRNIELNEKYPFDKAMKIARESFKADIEAGFNYLHIDPTKCPLDFTINDICNWTVELVEFCEDIRKSAGKAAVDYEVGTEDIQGGLTSAETFEFFLKALVDKLRAKNLPLPTCVVAQTGTLARIDRNVGSFNKKQVEELIKIAAKYGVGLKEHNGDYLSAASCRVHPKIGITGMNVAPEFGLIETDACLYLESLEQKLVREGWIETAQASGLRELFIQRTFTESPWKKWMTEQFKELAVTTIESDSAIRLLIARVCGHYVYDTAEVILAREKLYHNINRFELVDDAYKFIIDRVRQAIEFYLACFKLKGVNSLV